MTSSGRVVLLGFPTTCGAFATFNSTLLLLIYSCISGKNQTWDTAYFLTY